MRLLPPAKCGILGQERKWRGMKSICVQEMRREHKGAWGPLLFVGVAFLMLTSVFGALLIVRDKSGANSQGALLFIGLGLAAFIICLGLYLVQTDTKRLIRKTPFGQALSRLGNPEQILAEIDTSALTYHETLGPLTLLDGWMLLHYPNGVWNDPMRWCAMPIRRSDIGQIQLLPDKNSDDPEERHLILKTRDGEIYDFYVFQQSALTILNAWLEEQEQIKP